MRIAYQGAYVSHSLTRFWAGNNVLVPIVS